MGLSNDPVVDVAIFPSHTDHVALAIVIKTRDWLFVSKGAELGAVRLLERLSFYVRKSREYRLESVFSNIVLEVLSIK